MGKNMKTVDLTKLKSMMVIIVYILAGMLIGAALTMLITAKGPLDMRLYAWFACLLVLFMAAHLLITYLWIKARKLDPEEDGFNRDETRREAVRYFSDLVQKLESDSITSAEMAAFDAMQKQLHQLAE